MTEPRLALPQAAWPHQGNLLSPVVRRDIADLNRLYLAHVLDPSIAAADSWFALPHPTLKQFEGVTPEARERAAWSPISLFELTLPEPDATLPWGAQAVGDAAATVAGEQSRGEVRRSFGLVALGVARRLAETVPFASRIAFGLRPACEARLSALAPSDTYRYASWPGLIRPRWPSHARYWNQLAAAAAGSSEADLFWAYATGLCLLGHCEREPVEPRHGPGRRPRPTHRRGPTGRSDVPC